MEGFDWNVITAITAIISVMLVFIFNAWGIFISWISTNLAIEESKRKRDHDKLSVIPSLSIILNRSTDESTSIILKNVGLGPAKILSYSVFLDGHEMKMNTFNDIDRLKIRRCDYYLQLPSHYGFLVSNIEVNQILDASFKEDLLKFSMQELDDEIKVEVIRFVHSNIKLEITYANIYDEPIGTVKFSGGYS